jgi:hypothetical protein
VQIGRADGTRRLWKLVWPLAHLPTNGHRAHEMNAAAPPFAPGIFATATLDFTSLDE